MGFLARLISPITDIVNKFVPDKDLAAQLAANLQMKMANLMEEELRAQKEIILAEAKGGWLQRNWRPLMMVWFAVLIGAHWFGFTPPNLTPDMVHDLYRLVQIGIGGYIVGRSAEKIAPMMMKGKEG